MSSQKTAWIVGGVIVAVVVLIAVFLNRQNNGVTPNGTTGTAPSVKVSSTVTFTPLTNTEKDANITKPAEVVTGNINIFKLKAENGAFSPNELVFGKGQRVQIEFTAVGADYDLNIALPIGAYIVAKKDKTEVFGFDAEKNKEGVYTFSCRDYCPAGKEMKGKIVVK